MTTVAALFPGRGRGPNGSFTERLLAYARTLQGVPYEINLSGFPRQPGRGMGKKFPQLDGGLDCSGYVLNVLQHMGLLTDLDPDFTNCNVLFERCDRVAPASVRPGDLVFFEGTFNQPGMTHIGIVTKSDGTVEGTAMISAREPIHPGVRIDDPMGPISANFAAFGRLKSLPE